MPEKGTAEQLRARTSDTVNRTTKRARGVAQNLKNRRKNGRAASVAASAMSAVSTSLEAVANGARTSGLAIRDRGRDAARKVSRGERVLRERGLGGAARDLGRMTRRHAGKLAVAGAGIATAIAVRRRRRPEGNAKG